MADAHPEATVVGVDLSPIQPSWTPPHCFFFVDDSQQVPWEFEAKFDVIHLRNMEGAFSDWTSVYQQVFDNLRPGGVVEIQSQEAWVYSLDKTVPESIIDWLNLVLAASRSFGRNIGMSKEHKDLIKEAGFEEIEHVSYKLPIGPWAKQDKPLAEVFLAVVLDAIEAYSLELFTRELNMDVS